ncbi:hypothetical protein K491DRAFT_36225 [Lophiostoma macrostomum CBS 122681]|uniref:Uncharacterized protein n=1 Tax=Lophiostoma macrostomum CBS 122681 TaxID=1314788 RepID=A0A6A6SYP4_9PLEO|nr:hypothetical protein K491DRAFT_36225 [Lophiostoma macrostomum CBS 122681]
MSNGRACELGHPIKNVSGRVTRRLVASFLSVFPRILPDILTYLTLVLLARIEGRAVNLSSEGRAAIPFQSFVRLNNHGYAQRLFRYRTILRFWGSSIDWYTSRNVRECGSCSQEDCNLLSGPWKRTHGWVRISLDTRSTDIVFRLSVTFQFLTLLVLDPVKA